MDFMVNDRFQIIRGLGAGGMGVVYQVLDSQRDSVVALKVLSQINTHSLVRFKNEFRALSGILHPNLVELYELFSDGGTWCYTMELIQDIGFLQYVRPGTVQEDRSRASSSSGGGLSASGLTGQIHTLSQDGFAETTMATQTSAETDQLDIYIKAADPRLSTLDEPRLRHCFAQLVQGVSAIHQAGKLHRDIKPSNILVTDSGRVALADFGLVTDSGDEVRAAMEKKGRFGTLVYMSPEQAAGGDLAEASDWYSVGAVLYKTLTGRVPFIGDVKSILQAKQEEDPPAPEEVDPRAPQDLRDLCIALLKRDARARPTGRDIQGWLGQSTMVAVPAALPVGQSSPFVGREEQLEALNKAFLQVREGQCVITQVHGMSGMGKSTLIDKFLTDIRKDDPETLVLTCRCYERESMPYKALDGLIDSLVKHIMLLPQSHRGLLFDEDVAILVRIFPVLHDMVGTLEQGATVAQVVDPLQNRQRAARALRQLFTRLSSKYKLILYIDDLQWGDLDSGALLTEALQPPGTPPLMLLLAYRQEEREHSPLLKALLDTDAFTGFGHHEILVNALPLDKTQELANQLGALTEKDRARLAQIFQETGGNPFFITELVRHVLSGADLEQTRTGKELTLNDLVMARYARLPGHARQLLKTIAVAGCPMAQRIILKVGDIPKQEVYPTLSVLRHEHLIRTAGLRPDDDVEVYHDRIREVVNGSLSIDERTEIHRRFAERIERDDPHGFEALVTHWLGAGDFAKTVFYARLAGEKAAESLAFDRAADLFQLALVRGSLNDAQRRSLGMQLADALLNARRGKEAAEAFLKAAEQADWDTKLLCWPKAAEQFLITGHIDQGLALMAQVLAEVGEKLPPTPLRALLSLVLARVRLRLRGTRWQKRPVEQLDPHMRLRLDTYWAVGIGLVMVDNIVGALFQSRCLLLALDSGDQRRIGRSLALEALLHSTQGTGSLVRANELLNDARRAVEGSNDAFLHAWIKGTHGFVEYFSGHFPLGVKLLEESERQYRDETAGTTMELNNVRVFKLQGVRYMGFFNQLIAAVEEYDRDAIRRCDRYFHTMLTRAFNGVYLAADRPQDGRLALENTTWNPPSHGWFHMQHWFELRATAELDMYSGVAVEAWPARQKTFRALTKSMLMRVQTIRAEGKWLRGRMALAGNGPLRLAEKMVRELRTESIGFAEVWSQLLFSCVLARKGQLSACVGALRQAIALAERESMWLCAMVAKLRLGQLQGGAEGKALQEEARSWMQVHGITHPDRMAEMIAPEFIGQG